MLTFPRYEVGQQVASEGKRIGAIVAVFDENEHGFVYLVRVPGLRARAPQYSVLFDRDFTSGQWQALSPIVAASATQRAPWQR